MTTQPPTTGPTSSESFPGVPPKRRGKMLKVIVLGLLAVILIVFGVVWFNLNGIVRRTVETQASSSLDLKTTLGGANVSLFGGSVSLNDLKIASPPGFKAEQMMTLGEAGVQVALSKLREDPIHISQVNIDKPHIVIEAQGTKLNFQAVMDQKSKTPTEPSDSSKPAEPLKMIIDELNLTGAQVALRPGLSIGGLKEEYTLTIPNVTLRNIGQGEGAQNGAAIKEVVVKVLAAVAEAAAKSDQLPPELKQLLNLNVDAVKARVGEEINKQVDKVTSDLEKKLGEKIPQGTKDDVEKGIGDLLGGKDKKKKSSSTKEK